MEICSPFNLKNRGQGGKSSTLWKSVPPYLTLRMGVKGEICSPLFNLKNGGVKEKICHRRSLLTECRFPSPKKIDLKYASTNKLNMCYQCILSYFRYRMVDGFSFEVLESIVASIAGVEDYTTLQNQQNSTLPHRDNEEEFTATIEQIKTRLNEFGFSVMEEPAPPAESTISLGPGNPILQMLMQAMGESLMSRIRQEDEEEEEEKTETFAEHLLKQTDPKEVRAEVTKVCSKTTLPITDEYKEWLTEVFNQIPMEHTYRPLILQTAMKTLNMAPSDFKRNTDQIAELVKESFYLQESVSSEDNCSICQTEFSESCNKLSDPSNQKRELYLICGKFYGKECPHSFCYPCFQRLQSTLIGDNCPICREHYKGILPPELDPESEKEEDEKEKSGEAVKKGKDDEKEEGEESKTEESEKEKEELAQ